MARYQPGNFGFKTLELEPKKDPIKNLWRNVLVVGIEDLLKNKELQAMRNDKKFSNHEVWFYSKDFELICEYSELAYKIVRKRVFEAIERIRKKYEKNNMSKMSGKWLYKGKTINRGPNRYSTTMYNVQK